MGSRTDAPKERLGCLRELLGMVEVRKVRSGGPCGFDAEAFGETIGGLREEWVAVRADEELYRRCDRGERLIVGKVGIEGTALYAEVGIRTREHPVLNVGFQALPVCVSGGEADEPPERRCRPARLHAVLDQLRQAVAHVLRVIEEREQRGLVEHRAAYGVRPADHRRQRKDPSAAGAEDRRRGQTKSREQRGRVIGLLLR